MQNAVEKTEAQTEVAQKKKLEKVNKNKESINVVVARITTVL